MHSALLPRNIQYGWISINIYSEYMGFYYWTCKEKVLSNCGKRYSVEDSFKWATDFSMQETQY